MYTIIRFTAAKEMVDRLATIGADMNKVRAGMFAGIRKAGDGFTCDVSRSHDWAEHMSGIEEFVQQFERTIELVVELGGRVTVDVAVDPEDITGIYRSIDFDDALLKTLVAHRLVLEITVYPGPERDDGHSGSDV
jgi:hypothetical protein